MRHKFTLILFAIVFIAAGCNKNSTPQTDSSQNQVQTESPETTEDNEQSSQVPVPTPVPTPTPTPSPTPAPAPAPTPTPVPPPPAPKQETKNFIVDADDYSATPSSITVNKGTKVNLVIRVKALNTYYAGLEYRSSVVSSGAIKPGESATLTFTASESFTLVPYWPSSGVQKDSKISVIVK
jgi:hypothetical protein